MKFDENHLFKKKEKKRVQRQEKEKKLKEDIEDQFKQIQESKPEDIQSRVSSYQLCPVKKNMDGTFIFFNKHEPRELSSC